MKSLQLLGDRIIARLITPDRSSGGIVLPECAGNTDNTRLAEVLHVGPGRTLANGVLVETVVKPLERRTPVAHHFLVKQIAIHAGNVR